jgi:hypothetical protein
MQAPTHEHARRSIESWRGDKKTYFVHRRKHLVSAFQQLNGRMCRRGDGRHRKRRGMHGNKPDAKPLDAFVDYKFVRVLNVFHCRASIYSKLYIQLRIDPVLNYRRPHHNSSTIHDLIGKITSQLDASCSLCQPPPPQHNSRAFS